jgi:hypothetical protein
MLTTVELEVIQVRFECMYSFLITTRCHLLALGKIALLVLQLVLVGSTCSNDLLAQFLIISSTDILGLRVYAMYNFSKIVLLSLMTSGLVAFLLAWVSHNYSPPSPC